jgi:hypothetical protein
LLTTVQAGKVRRRQKSILCASCSPPVDEYDAKVVDMCLDRTALDETAGRMSQTGMVVLLHEIGGIEIGGSCSMPRLGKILRAEAWAVAKSTAIDP